MVAATPDQNRSSDGNRRPELVHFGRIGKPHGFRGAFISTVLETTAPVLSHLKEIYVGETAETAVPYPLLEATWMPKGWKLVLGGIESDATVKAMKGTLLFLERSALPPTEEGEFYLADLVGCEVKEEETGKIIGCFEGMETVGMAGEAPDRWWIRTESDLIAVPAVKSFIAKVDVANRLIWVKNLSNLE